jgi:hypothetical protein
MNEMQWLGSLIPAHPDFLLLLQNIREKYGIEVISPGDDSIKELILNEGIDLEIIRQDIEDQLRVDPHLFPLRSCGYQSVNNCRLKPAFQFL